MDRVQDIEILGPKKEQDFNSFIWNNTEEITYGPVDSRRLGDSLGINLFPYGKVCEFSCIYCDCGPSEDTVPTATLDKIIEDIEKGLRNHQEKGTPIDYITFAGNGEPTNCPYFPQVVQAVLQLRSKLFPDTPLAIFTNCMSLHQPEIQIALRQMDEVFFKLDAADQQTFERVNRPRDGRKLDELISLIAEFHRPKISTAVIEKPRAFSNIRSITSAQFAKSLHSVEASTVYLYSIDYPSKKGILSTSLENLLQIANRIQEFEPMPIKVLTTMPKMADVAGYEM